MQLAVLEQRVVAALLLAALELGLDLSRHVAQHALQRHGVTQVVAHHSTGVAHPALRTVGQGHAIGDFLGKALAPRRREARQDRRAVLDVDLLDPALRTGCEPLLGRPAAEVQDPRAHVVELAAREVERVDRDRKRLDQVAVAGFGASGPVLGRQAALGLEREGHEAAHVRGELDLGAVPDARLVQVLVTDDAEQLVEHDDRDVEQRADVALAQVRLELLAARIAVHVLDRHRGGLPQRAHVFRTQRGVDDDALRGLLVRAGELHGAGQTAAIGVEEPDAGAPDLERLTREPRDLEQGRRQARAQRRALAQHAAHRLGVIVQAARERGLVREPFAVLGLAGAQPLEVALEPGDVDRSRIR